jgi:hypothetical protein
MNAMTRSTAHRTSGFTITEVLVALGAMLVVAGAAFSVLTTSSASLAEGTSGADLQTSARRILDRIGEDFRRGILSTLTLTGTHLVSVRPAMGYVDGSVTQGVSIGYQLKADPRGASNVVTRTEGGVETTIAGSVKDLSFTLSGNLLTCAVTLERVVRGSRTLQYSDAIQLRLRN